MGVRRTWVVVVFFLAAPALPSSAPGHPCEAKEPLTRDDGSVGYGRAVDPVRLLGSKTLFHLGLTVFVGHDARTLCAFEGPSTLRWESTLKSGFEDAVVAVETTTLILSNISAFVVGVVRQSRQYPHPRIGIFQLDLATGAEVSRRWLPGSCIDEVRSRRVPWSREDWRNELGAGDLLDLNIDSGENGDSVWVPAAVLHRQDGVVSVVHSGRTSPVDLDLAAGAGYLRPYMTQQSDWAVEVQGGDYVEIQAADRSWNLAKVSEILETDDARNGHGARLLHIDDQWWPVASARIAKCGSHTNFSDAPRQLAVIETDDGRTLAIVLLDRLPGLRPLVVAYDTSRSNASATESRSMNLAWSTTLPLGSALPDPGLLQPPMFPEIMFQPNSSPSSVFFVTCLGQHAGDRRVVALSASTGRVLWHYDVVGSRKKHGAVAPVSTAWTSRRRDAARTAAMQSRSVSATPISDGRLLLWLEDQKSVVVVHRDGRVVPVIIVEKFQVLGGPCLFIDVPLRTQFGPTCGLHALAMVLNYWRFRSNQCKHVAACPTPTVGDEALGSKLAMSMLATRNTPPSKTAPEGSLLSLAQFRGYTALGEMFNATQLAGVASAAGYRAAVHRGAVLNDIRRLLEDGRPLLAPFDVGASGGPIINMGESAHYAVLLGLVDVPGEGPVLLARHSWNLRDLHLWSWSDFKSSWEGLEGTSFYGDPSDGGSFVPASIYTEGRADLRRPTRMALPRAKGLAATASTSESLAGILIEVVPADLDLIGNFEVFAPINEDEFYWPRANIFPRVCVPSTKLMFVCL